MEIIQSFAQFEEGSPYLQHRRKRDYVYLLFYSYLFSHITISKQYGGFTMFCNKRAYESMLKYIPYHKFQIMENNNEFRMWSKYKIDVMKTINEDFIHIDPDVSLFKNVLDEFINGRCDILVQDIVPFKENSLKPFIFDNTEFFADTKILTKPFDGRAMSCGTVGLTKEVQEYYFTGIDILYDAMLEIGLDNILSPTLVLEEQLLYLLAVENDFVVHNIVEYEMMINYGILNVGETHGYLHLWMQSKFQRKIIDLVRRRIFFEYPEYYEDVLIYEHEVLSKFEFFKHFNFPKIYSNM